LAVIATLSKGYDLDYIWKQVDPSLAKEGAGYYIKASETGGEPPGRWWGPGAQTLGLQPGQLVEREQYDLLFGERKAPDGTQLGKPPGSGRKAADIYARLLAAEPHATAERKRELRLEATRQARQSPLFFDLTLSLSKSISIFHASLGENARLARQAGDAAGEAYWSGLVAEVDAMIWQAVRAGFGYFQKEAGYTRTGSHNKRAGGRETGQWHEADLVVAHWLQHTSRDGDMQLHVHSQIAHVARTVTDGKWRAPDSLGYNEHVGAVGAITAQHLEEALTARFGLEWTARDDGHGFEITGIPGEMIRVFSSRRESITADLRARAARFEQQYGRAPSQQVAGGEAGRRVRVLGQRGDCHVCAPVGDLAGCAAPQLPHDQYLRHHVGVAGGQPLQRGREQVHGGAAEGRDPQRALDVPRGRAACLGRQQVELTQDQPRVHDRPLSGRGRHGPAPAALEQHGAHLALGRAHGVRDRRLGQVQALGRRGETAGVRHGHEKPQVLSGEVGAGHGGHPNVRSMSRVHGTACIHRRATLPGPPGRP
jgi:TrwC relaxase